LSDAVPFPPFPPLPPLPPSCRLKEWRESEYSQDSQKAGPDGAVRAAAGHTQPAESARSIRHILRRSRQVAVAPTSPCQSCASPHRKFARSLAARLRISQAPSPECCTTAVAFAQQHLIPAVAFRAPPAPGGPHGNGTRRAHSLPKGPSSAMQAAAQNPPRSSTGPRQHKRASLTPQRCTCCALRGPPSGLPRRGGGVLTSPAIADRFFGWRPGRNTKDLKSV